MPEPIERSVFSGVNTDSSGERLGDQALNLKNVTPVSETNIRPRQGTTEVAVYTPSIGGRPTIIDAAPADLEQGILIVCMNNYYSNGGILVHEIERLFRFRPSRTANLYSNVQGIQLEASFFGAFDNEAQAFDFILDTYTPFIPANFENQDFVAVAFTRQGTYDETGWGDGFFTYSKGLAAYLTIESVDGGFLLRSKFYDVNGQNESEDTRLIDSMLIEDADWFNVGIAPLGSDIVGAIMWYVEFEGDTRLKIMRNRVWDNGELEGQGTLSVLVIDGIIEIEPDTRITDVSPISKTRQIGILVCRREVGSGKFQAFILQEQVDADVGGTATEFFETVATHDYIQADWSTWSDRPDTALEGQQIPLLANRQVAHIVLLLGNWETPGASHKLVSNPRLALVIGPGQTGNLQTFTNRTVAPLKSMEVANSHADQSTYVAHGMVVDQFGYVYAVGTGDFVSDTADFLIVKYSPWNFDIRVAGVEHESNGLGDFYDNPLNTHICNPMIDGAYLIVQDVDDEKTRIFVYDLDLNFVSKTVIGDSAFEATGAAAGNAGPGNISWVVSQVPGGGVATALATGLSDTTALAVIGFGFNIPADATVTGVKASINRKKSATAGSDVVVEMIVNGAGAGDNKASGTPWPATFTVEDYGGSGDDWGNTLTPDVINAEDFGFLLNASISAATTADFLEVESISITVYYTTAVIGPVVANKYATRFFADNY